MGQRFPARFGRGRGKVGDSITARRVDSKPVTVEQLQEQPDGTKQVVRVDNRNDDWLEWGDVIKFSVAEDG